MHTNVLVRLCGIGINTTDLVAYGYLLFDKISTSIVGKKFVFLAIFIFEVQRIKVRSTVARIDSHLKGLNRLVLHFIGNELG